MRLRLSLRRRFFVAILLASLIPLLTFIFLAAQTMRAGMRQTDLREVQRSGEFTWTIIDGEGQRMLATARALALEDGVRQDLVAADRRPLIDLSQEMSGGLDGQIVAFVDDVGSVWVKTGPTDPYGDNLLTSVKSLRSALQGQESYDVEVGGTLGLGIRGFAPVVVNGKVVGVVVVSQKVDDHFLATLKQQSALDPFVIFTTGETVGDVVNPAMIQAVEKLGGRGVGFSRSDGHEWAYSAWPLRDPDGQIRAYLGVSTPLTDLEEAQAGLDEIAAAAVILALLLTTALAWFGSRRIVGRLDRLVAVAHGIAAGEPREIPRVASGDEIEDLGASLATMVRALSERTAHLRFVVTHAQGIFWQAVVTRTGDPARRYHWDIKVTDEAAAQRVFPIEVGPGETYADAWYDYKHPDDRPTMDLRAHTAFESGASRYTQEFRCRRRDGELRWLREDVSLEPVAEGCWSLVGVCTDVTERRQSEEALERLMRQNELILNSTADGIVVQDLDGRVIFANHAAEKLTGYSVVELLGARAHALCHHRRPDGSPNSAEECRIAAVGRTGTACRVTDEVFWRKDGTSFPVEYTANTIIHPDGSAGVVVTFQDVTERRAVERMKDEFVSVVSHELRTPLTSIRGSLGLLASGVLGSLPERGQRMLEIAVNNTDRLVRLINDILDIERMDSGKVTLDKKRCDVGELIAQAVEPLQLMAQKAGIALVARPVSYRIVADPDRIVQTLTNLMGNAIKFSPAGSTVRVEVEPDGAELCFRVSDQGRGIPTDKLEAVFDRFQQVDASDSREKGGSGLGLAICRSIVQQHGGRLWVQSALGEGSTFFFTLPGPVEADLLALPAPASRQSILVCGDTPSVRRATKDFLERQGFEVIVAESPELAITLAATRRPASIAVEVALASKDGDGLLAALKARAEIRDIPVIVFSVVPPSGRGSDEPVPSPDDAWLGEMLGRLLRPAGRSATVLVVEDDQDLGQVMVELFRRDEIEAILATTGREAIQLCQRIVPDLLVLDLVLPDGDGFAVVNWLRQYDRLRQVPLVVYSAKDVDEADRARLRLGKTQFFTKGRLPVEDVERQVLSLLDEIGPDLQEVGSR